MNAVIVLMAIIIALQVLIILLLKNLSDDMWDFRLYSDMQYGELLDTIDDCLRKEDEIFKTIRDWSEKK